MDEARCSFCGKSADAVDALIKAPPGYAEVYICSECVRFSAAILNGDDGTMTRITHRKQIAEDAGKDGTETE